MKTNSSETNMHTHQLMEYGNVDVFTFDIKRAETPTRRRLGLRRSQDREAASRSWVFLSCGSHHLLRQSRPVCAPTFVSQNCDRQGSSFCLQESLLSYRKISVCMWFMTANQVLSFHSKILRRNPALPHKVPTSTAATALAALQKIQAHVSAPRPKTACSLRIWVRLVYF